MKNIFKKPKKVSWLELNTYVAAFCVYTFYTHNSGRLRYNLRFVKPGVRMEGRDSKKFSCGSVDEFLKGLSVKGVVQS